MAQPQSAYINYKQWSARYDMDACTFSVRLDGMGLIIQGARITSLISAREPQVALSDFDAPVLSTARGEDSCSMTIRYPAGEMLRQDVSLSFVCSDAGVDISATSEGTMDIRLEGTLHWGDHDQVETMATSIGRQGYDLRSAYGPAASAVDDCLFDRDTDSAMRLSSAGKVRLRFDWEKRAYAFTFNTDGHDYARALHITHHTHVYESLFNMGYRKLMPNATFSTPPVG